MWASTTQAMNRGVERTAMARPLTGMRAAMRITIEVGTEHHGSTNDPEAAPPPPPTVSVRRTWKRPHEAAMIRDLDAEAAGLVPHKMIVVSDDAKVHLPVAAIAPHESLHEAMVK